MALATEPLLARLHRERAFPPRVELRGASREPLLIGYSRTLERGLVRVYRTASGRIYRASMDTPLALDTHLPIDARYWCDDRPDLALLWRDLTYPTPEAARAALG